MPRAANVATALPAVLQPRLGTVTVPHPSQTHPNGLPASPASDGRSCPRKTAAWRMAKKYANRDACSKFFKCTVGLKHPGRHIRHVM
jgi:hypothetical protein